jgi:hypothetical protein
MEDWKLSSNEENYIRNLGYKIPDEKDWNLTDPFLGFKGPLRQLMKQLRHARLYSFGPKGFSS